MSQVLTVRIDDDQMDRLRRMAERLGRTPSETSELPLDEALRSAEHPLIQFRDSPIGRQAYVQDSGLAVWEVALVARSYGGDARQVATHLEWPPAKVQAVLDYAAAYPAEIGAALAENAVGFEGLARMLPEAERLTVPNDDEPSTDEPDQTGVASR